MTKEIVELSAEEELLVLGRLYTFYPQKLKILWTGSKKSKASPDASRAGSKWDHVVSRPDCGGKVKSSK